MRSQIASFIVIAVMIVTIGVAALSQAIMIAPEPQSAPTYPGYHQPMPVDSLLLCRPDPTSPGRLECMSLPPGSLLLIPKAVKF